MKTIISSETRRRRDKRRKELTRRAEGAKPRAEYLAGSKAKRDKDMIRARALRDEGKSFREIGRKLNTSHTQARRLLE